jgi:SAM-dependent methyltransferase
VSGAASWLDLGCGHEFLPGWLPEPDRRLDLASCRVVGIDMDQAALRRHPALVARVRGNVERLPFADDAFDLVTANTVIEHVEQPLTLFEEVRRVLRPGGRFLLHTPNVFGYTTMLTRAVPGRLRAPLARLLQDRDESDVYPTHYRANSAGTLFRLAHQAGLTVHELRYVHSSPQLIFIPPLMVLELLFLRLLSARSTAVLRPCLLALLLKPAHADSGGLSWSGAKWRAAS